MKKSESICELAKALAKVQASLVPAKRDSTNPYFNSTYADLSSVWESCRETLAKNGLCVIQGNSVGAEKTLIVETILIHESGQWVQSELCLPLSKADPQGVGSAMTYGRRYGLANIVAASSPMRMTTAMPSAKHGNANVRPMRPNERPVNGNHRSPVNPLPHGSISLVEDPTMRITVSSRCTQLYFLPGQYLSRPSARTDKC